MPDNNNEQEMQEIQEVKEENWQNRIQDNTPKQVQQDKPVISNFQHKTELVKDNVANYVKNRIVRAIPCGNVNKE